jgi:hypothetical protein
MRPIWFPLEGVEADGFIFGPGFIWVYSGDRSGLGGLSVGETVVSGSLDNGINELEGASTGATTITGTLHDIQKISAVGRTTVTGTLDNAQPHELAGTSLGETVVSGQISIPFDFPYQPQVYVMGFGVDGVSELSADLSLPHGVTTAPRTYVWATLEVALQGLSTGETVVGSPNFGNPYQLAGSSDGETVVTGELYVDGVAELAVSSYGETIVFAIGDLTSFAFTGLPSSIYHQYGNAGVGFDPTDEDLSLDDNNYADGNIVEDFPRFLSLYLDVGVGFDYTDDASSYPGFVSQTYPDGNIIEDWPRFLTQYVNITTGITPGDCRLTIGPAPRGHKDLTPTPRPPRQAKR